MSVRWLKPLGFTALAACVLAAGASTTALGARTAPRSLLRNSTPRAWGSKHATDRGGRPHTVGALPVMVGSFASSW